ncbi:YgaP-like transmembrane domain [Acidiphilium sp.]|uniref:YgaP-like transmembrane domain n=1 Tax=Acidiphilium sp. TaxID=527 RepID=UPI003D02FDE2
MTIDNAVMSFAGAVVLLGLLLGWLVTPYFYLLTAFAGLNLVQAGITGLCPAAMIFKRLGLKPGCAFR